MRITRLEEKKAHSFASKIPSGLWWDEFNGSFDDDKIPSADKNLNQVKRDDLPSNDIKALIVLLLRYPDVDPPKLILSVRNILNVSNKKIFPISAALGHLDTLKWLKDQEPHELSAMIQADRYSAFRGASENGHLDTLKWLKDQEPHELSAMIQADRYTAFRGASENGHLDTLKWLKEQAPNEELSAMIQVYNYAAFRLASENGHLDTLEWLKEQAPHELSAMIQAEQHGAFGQASGNGCLDTLEWLKEQAPNGLSAMIQGNDYFAFRWASKNGHLDTLKWLKDQEPHELSAMIQAGSYYAFRLASANGHLDTLEWLKEQAPHELSAMIQVGNYAAFREASANGHLDTLQWLKEQAPNELSAMIKVGDYAAFQYASAYGHLDTLQWLKEQAPNELSAMIQVGDYAAFHFASANGYLDILKWIKEQAPPNDLSAMILSGNYAAFRSASAIGHLDTLKWFKEQAPNELSAMIQANYYTAFSCASAIGHLDTLKWFKEQAPNELSTMIQANSYAAFRWASEKGHLDTLKWLLQDPKCLSYAEQHVQEYGEQVVNPFISETLAALHQESEIALQNNPNAVFDITDEQRAQSCFYILRNLIRRNAPALNDELLFLLDIPAVKALVHTAVTPNRPNELLRLAITTGNQDAAERLLTIPAVRQLAEQNNFYRGEARGQLDLRALAQDRESSMHALTTGEQQRIAEVIKRYQPLIKAAGLEHLIQELRDQLTQRYEERPAKINVNGVECTLPTTWEAFQALKLNEEARDAALLAYRQNKTHTALRYLSKPNHWMAQNASYVYVNPENTNERWSTFEGYSAEIALFWLAAQDITMPATDGHTLVGRLDHFIDELAHIGRAHNWDKTRLNALGAREEYDDLEGDKPSCFSGVKRRLMQSVIGHPLLKLLTENDLNEELRDFTRTHFLSFITKGNQQLITDTLDEYTYDLTEIQDNEGTALLKAMDIRPELQKNFITYLGNKYGAQFHSEPRFKQLMIEQFKLEENRQKPATYAHVFKFSGLTGIHEHVTKLIEMDTTPLNTVKEADPTVAKPIEIDTPLKQIKEAAQLGIKKYLDWSKGDTSLRGSNGFFTRLRHGQAGISRAVELNETLEKQTTPDDLIGVIDDFLRGPQTRYHQHSLASFLLDELKIIPDSHWKDTASYPNYKPYPDNRV